MPQAADMLNRCAIILTPRAPYIAWANSLEIGGPKYEEIGSDEGSTAYLGPDVDTLDDVNQFIRTNVAYFFEAELERWCTDPALWPPKRTYRLFTDWFAVRWHSMIVDTLDEPLELA